MPWATGGNGEVSFDLSTGAVINAVTASGVIESVGMVGIDVQLRNNKRQPKWSSKQSSCRQTANLPIPQWNKRQYYCIHINIGFNHKPLFPTSDRLNVPRLTYQNGGAGVRVCC